MNLRYLSLFSGIEAATVAWKPLGWEAAAFAQYEPNDKIQFPSKVLEYHYPDVPNLGDVTKISEEQIKALGHIDLVVGGSPCFAAGTMVLTEQGYRPIEEIEVGDLVFTHKGNLKKVVRTGHKEAETFSLKSSGKTETIVTGNHPYYERKRNWVNEKKTNKRVFSDAKWTEVSELDKDSFLATPVIPEFHDDERLDDEALWILGRYIADGHYRKELRKEGTNHYQYQVIISVGEDKLDDFKAHVKDRHFSCYKHSQSVYRCTFSSMELVGMIEEYGIGDHSYNKQIPLKLLGLPKEKLEVLLEGYWSGDGCVTNKGHEATTVSERLALTLALAIVKVYGVLPVVSRYDAPSKGVICGREVNQRPAYTIRWKETSRKMWIKDDQYLWGQVRSKTPVGVNVVYNLEVEDNHTYIANNAVVHNCQDLSTAGKRAGLKKEDGSLTRSGLFDYQMQIFEWAVKNNGARFMLWENVPGAFSSNQGNDFAYILGTMVQGNVPVPRDGWKNSGICVSEDGRRIVEWCVLDAQHFGVPQRRRRVFAILDTGAWGGRPPILFESKSLSGDFEKGGREGKNSSEDSEEDFGEDGFDAERGGYKLVGSLCADDRKGAGNQYVDQGKVVMEPCRDENTFAVSQENHMDIATNIAPPLKRRNYKAPNTVCYEESVVAIEGNGMRPSHKGAGINDEGVSYTLNTTEVHGVGYKEPRIYDMKQHHAPSESDTIQLTTGNCKGVRGDTPLVMDVVSWKERDRMAQIRNNLTDPITATDYKGPSFVGYIEKMEDGHDS